MNMLYGVVWGTKHGRLEAKTISEYEHLAFKINRIYLHLVCPLWFPALFAITVIPVRRLQGCTLRFCCVTEIIVIAKQA